MPNPNLVSWLDEQDRVPVGMALTVGSGLGDDSKELARRGFATTAFDVSRSVIARSRARFPDSSVGYVVSDLSSAPAEWRGRFDFVLESYTLQVLPPELRAEAIQCIASFVAPAGTLLVIARGRETNESVGEMPWPLTKEELSLFSAHGLVQISFEDYSDGEDPPVRRFRGTYGRDRTD